MIYQASGETQQARPEDLRDMRELDLDELEAVGGAGRRNRAGEGTSSGALHWFFSLFT